VVDLFRVQKDIVLYERLTPLKLYFEAGFVRIVDIEGSPRQFSDKGIAGMVDPDRRRRHL
jgi:hypothetical protein